MKKYLIPNEGNFYKVNLHCHTNLSDGHATPVQVKDFYKSKGYSAVAFTDHDAFIPHNDLTDNDFIALNGFEMEFADFYDCYANGKPWNRVKQCHICFIAKDDKMDIQPFYHRTKYAIGNKETRKLIKYDDSQPDFERWYTPNCINYCMQVGRKLGFFVMYNHPTWSLEDYSDYSKYKGMHAIEIINAGSAMLGFPEYNHSVYDDILRLGNKVNAVASDDNHYADDSLYSDSGKAWTMVKASELSYDGIMTALYKGNYYASEGPEIHEIFVEDGILKIKCSDAQIVKVNYEARKAQIKLIEDGTPITEAEFEISKVHGYFRVTVIGLDGKKAYTSAYYLEDLGE